VAPPAVHSKPFARGSLLLIGLAWTLPFLQPHHRFPLTAFYSEWLAFGLGLAAALLLAARQSWREAELPVMALVPPALALLMGVQSALGRVPYPEQVVTATYYLLWASLLMLLARVLARELGMAAVATTLAWFLLVGGVLSALAGFIQHYHFFPALEILVTQKMSPRVYGNLGQPNHYAAYVTMGLCSVAYLYGSGRLRAAWAIACAALLLPALALSGSRSPWLYLGILAVLALLLFRARREAASRRLLVYSLCLIPGFVVAGFIVAQWGASASSAVAATGEQVTSAQRLFDAAAGVDNRLHLAFVAWAIFLQAPFLGVGWGQFAWHYFEHQAQFGPGIASLPLNHAHNIVLQLLAETGIAGTLLFLGAALHWLWGQRRVLLDLDRWWLFALLAVIGIHSLLEYPLWYAYFLGVAAILLGLGSERNHTMDLGRIGRPAALVVLAAGAFALYSVSNSYRDFERLFVLGAAMPEENEVAAILSRAYRQPVLAPYANVAVSFGIDVDRNGLREKLEFNGRVMRFAPLDVVVYRHAMLLALAGEREAARNQLVRAARAYPGVLPAAIKTLREQAGRYPVELTPLLELAISKNAQLRASRGIE
jgi:O-antigen ligase